MKSLVFSVLALAWSASAQPNEPTGGHAPAAKLGILGYRHTTRYTAELYLAGQFGNTQPHSSLIGKGIILTQRLDWWSSDPDLQTRNHRFCVFRANLSKIRNTNARWVDHPIPDTLGTQNVLKEPKLEPKTLMLALLKRLDGTATSNAMLIPADLMPDAPQLGIQVTCATKWESLPKPGEPEPPTDGHRFPDLNKGPAEVLDYLELQTEDGYGRPDGLDEMPVPQRLADLARQLKSLRQQAIADATQDRVNAARNRPRRRPAATPVEGQSSGGKRVRRPADGGHP